MDSKLISFIRNIYIKKRQDILKYLISFNQYQEFIENNNII